jgi:hypothetical protein
MLLLGLNPVGQLCCLSDELVGFAGFAQPVGALLAEVEDVDVQLLDLSLAGSDRTAINKLLLRRG